jgi:hypothetical protein
VDASKAGNSARDASATLRTAFNPLRFTLCTRASPTSTNADSAHSQSYRMLATSASLIESTREMLSACIETP